MKNILVIIVGLFALLNFTSCKSLQTQETKTEIKQIASSIVDVSLDYTAYKFSKELKPVNIALKSDTIQNITFIDKFGFVRLDKRETADSLFLELSPIWITIRDTVYTEAVKFTKTQSGFVKDVVGLSLNLAMIEASNQISGVTIKLPKYNFEERSYVSKNRIIIVRVCPDDRCLLINLDPFEFSNLLKRLSREKIFKL